MEISGIISHRESRVMLAFCFVARQDVDTGVDHCLEINKQIDGNILIIFGKSFI